LADVKRLDEAIRADRLELELAMKNNCDANRRNNLLNDPSRRGGVPVVTLQCTLTIITHGVAMSLAIAMPCYVVMCSQYISGGLGLYSAIRDVWDCLDRHA